MKRVDAVVAHYGDDGSAYLELRKESGFAQGARVVVMLEEDARRALAPAALSTVYNERRWADLKRDERERGRVESAEAIAAWLMSDRFGYNDHYPCDISALLRIGHDWRAFLKGPTT